MTGMVKFACRAVRVQRFAMANLTQGAQGLLQARRSMRYWAIPKLSKSKITVRPPSRRTAISLSCCRREHLYEGTSKDLDADWKSTMNGFADMDEVDTAGGGEIRARRDSEKDIGSSEPETIRRS